MANNPNLINSVQQLRGVAAIMVVFHHLITPPEGFFSPFAGISLGVTGVDIFFVISGFVMYTIARNEDPATFAWRRVLRVVPLYWIATAAFTALVIGNERFPLQAWHVVASLVFLPVYSPVHPGEIWPILVPGWTLNYEMFFYAIFAVGLIVRRPLLVCSSSILALVGAGLIFRPLDAILTMYTSPLLLEFLAGILIAVVYAKWPFRRLGMLLPVGFAGLALTSTFHFSSWFAPLTLASASAVVVGALALETYAKSSKVIALNLLGNASYSLYLTHSITLLVVFAIWKRLAFAGWIQFFGVFGTGLVTSVLVALVVHFAVERPLVRINRKRRMIVPLTQVE